VGETFDVPGRGGVVSFIRVIQDSRCPTGVTCVWEGDATVEVGVQRGGQLERVQLHTNDRFAREGAAAGLRVRLVSLEPYPQADRSIPPDAYRVVLSITTE
jgi:hypothetical protein